MLAEVMDKEPAAHSLLIAGLCIALAAFFAVRFSRWLLLLFAPVACIAAVGLTGEIRDPFVGPAIVQEAGYRYVVLGYIAASAPAVGCILGLIYRRERDARGTQQA